MFYAYRFQDGRRWADDPLAAWLEAFREVGAAMPRGAAVRGGSERALRVPTSAVHFLRKGAIFEAKFPLEGICAAIAQFQGLIRVLCVCAVHFCLGACQ